jgi:phage tail sheath protein FI
MPKRLPPGVYIEELPFASHAIQGVSTSTVGFVAVTGRGPLLGPLTSFVDFERVATPNLGVNLPLAVRGFFENGGQLCFISQIAAADPLESGLAALDKETTSLVCCPDDATIQNSAAAVAAHCEKRKDRVCILQSAQPIVPVATHQPPVHSSYGAYYYPWITVASLDGTSTVTLPPCGHIAGIYAQTDATRGVWVAPIAPLAGITALSEDLTAAESDQLNSRGIDVLRSFPGQGIKLWGARTTTDQDSEYKYVSVRRFMTYLERSIDQGTEWAVFEPNSPALWAVVRSSIENFLGNVWKQGALQGTTREEAFFVRCDPTTMTQDDIDNGRLVCLVGVAPVRPAEFVILQIGIWTQYPPQPPAH